MTEHTIAPDQQELKNTPGQILRAAREAQGRQPKDVAARLRLSVTLIQRIERDDYQYARAPIYCRGYLKNYARELGLSLDIIDQLIHTFNQMEIDWPADAERASVSLSSVPSYTTSAVKQRRYFRWVSLGVVMLLAIMVVLWWEGQAQNRFSPIQQPLMQPSSKTAEHVGVPTFHINTPAKPQKTPIPPRKAEKKQKNLHVSVKKTIQPNYTIVPVKQ